MDIRNGVVQRKWAIMSADVRTDRTILYYECVLTGDTKKVTHFYNKKHKLLRTEEEIIPKLDDAIDEIE